MSQAPRTRGLLRVEQLEPRCTPTTLVAVGAGAGGSPHVKVFAADGSLAASFFAYAAGFNGGVRVATGDVNLDGVDDIVTGTGPGGGPHVRIFSGASGTLLGEFLAFGAGFRGGVYVGAGDLNGDGRADVIAGAGAGGGPQVRSFSGAGFGLMGNFFAYGGAFTGGVTVAAGDVTGDGRDDIITGPGTGGIPLVRAFRPGGLLLGEILTFGTGFRGGVFVGAGDINDDGIAEIAVGVGQGSPPLVRLFAADGLLLGEVFAYGVNFAGGVRVAISDIAEDGLSEILLGPGAGGGPLARVLDPLSGVFLRSVFVFAPAFTGGIYVG